MARKGGTPENLIPAKAGEVRNPNGRSCVLPELKDMLKDILSEDISNAKGEKKQLLEVILRQLTNKAAKGDLRAIQEVFDRMYGKAKGSTDVSIGEGVNVIIRNNWDGDLE